MSNNCRCFFMSLLTSIAKGDKSCDFNELIFKGLLFGYDAIFFKNWLFTYFQNITNFLPYTVFFYLYVFFDKQYWLKIFLCTIASKIVWMTQATLHCVALSHCNWVALFCHNSKTYKIKAVIWLSASIIHGEISSL